LHNIRIPGRDAEDNPYLWRTEADPFGVKTDGNVVQLCITVLQNYA